MAFRPLPAIALSLVALLAGCAGDGAPGGTSDDLAGGSFGPDGLPVAALVNYTSPHPAGAPYVRDYAGQITPDELANSGSAPGGPEVGPFQTCCSMDWVPAADLLVPDQLVALRITLTWSNTPQDHAGLDAAACVPWNCFAFNQGPDESAQTGGHTDVLTLLSSGRAEFPSEFVTVGVRYANAAITTGLAYSLHVEATPVGDGLAFADPYLFTLPANATLKAHLVGPYATDGVSAGLMFYDATDRPFAYRTVQGANGTAQDIELPPGEYVVFQFESEGGFVRLAADGPVAGPLELRKLEEVFGQVEVATVDAQPHQGTFAFAAPPGALDSFPWFLYDGMPAVQDAFGAPADAVQGNHVTLTSSTGLVVEADIRQVAIGDPQGSGNRVCLQCNGNADVTPANYIDDDGTYDLAWTSQGGSGTFVIFTATYVRP